MRGKPVQYTVRNVPSRVDAVLRRRASEERKSLNQVLLEALEREAGLVGGAERRYHDLDDFVGTWVEDPEFDAAIAAQRTIDSELWE